MTPTRRLAAILAADVAGYSMLMRAYEEGTLRRYTWQCDFSGTAPDHEWLIWVASGHPKVSNKAVCKEVMTLLRSQISPARIGVAGENRRATRARIRSFTAWCFSGILNQKHRGNR